AALGEVRVATRVAQAHAGAGIPVPDPVVSEQAGDVASHLVGVEGTVVSEEELATALVTEGLPGKDAYVGEQGEGGEVGGVVDVRDAAGARVDVGDDRVLARMDERAELEPRRHVLRDEVVEAGGERADDGGLCRVRTGEGREVAVDVVRRDADASRQVGHEPAVVEVPAVARRRDEGHDGDAIHGSAALRAQPGINAVHLELGAPVFVDVVADAAPEIELDGGLRNDPDVTREVPLQGEVHAAREPEVEPLAVVEALRGPRGLLVPEELPPAHPGAQPQAPDRTQDPCPCHPRYLPPIFMPWPPAGSGWAAYPPPLGNRFRGAQVKYGLSDWPSLVPDPASSGPAP